MREAIKVSHKNEGRLSSGSIALTSNTDPNGWSYSELEGAASLVCLIRGDMVIAYQPSPEKKRQIPFLRGVFVVDSDKNKESAQILRLAEPHLHNSWQSKDERIVSPEDRKYAADLLDQIHLKVRDLRKAIKGVRRPINAQFRAFTKIFKGKAIVTPPPPPPPPKSRWISIQYPNGIKRNSGSSADTLALSAECKIALRDTPKNPAPDQLKIRVTLSWSVQEETLKADPALLNVSKDVIPEGFVSVNTGVYEGVINKMQILTFGWHSQEFSIDWSVAPTPIVEKVE